MYDWERFFAGIEGEIASEWEAERAALDSETERLRISRMSLAERLTAAAAERAQAVVDTGSGSFAGRVTLRAGDWFALAVETAMLAIPITSPVAITMDHASILRSTLPVPPSAVVQRMTFGYLCRDLARRRAVVRIGLISGSVLTGTIDRAGVDHMDLAVHDEDVPRRPHEVYQYTVIPVRAVAWLRFEEPGRSAIFPD